MLAEPALEERFHLVERDLLRAWLQRDEGLRRLPTIGVRDANHAALGDRRVLIDRLFDVAWIDIVAAAQEHVLDAVDDEDVAVLVHIADVARAQIPAVGLHLGRRLLVLPIAEHDIGALDTEFAALAERNVLIGIVDADEFDRDPWEGNAARARFGRSAHGRESPSRWRLSHAPALGNVTASLLFEPLRHFDRKR